MKQYELDSRDPSVALNKTAQRFYFQKMLALCGERDFAGIFGTEVLSAEEKREIFKKFVAIINIETNAFCNRRCPYCPVSETPRDNLAMQDYIFEGILEELCTLDFQSTISLNLYNEPLSDPQIVERVRRVREKLPRSFIRFNSNGDFLDATLLESLESAGLNGLNITLHTTKRHSYDEAESKKKLDKFYARLGFTPPNYEVCEGESIQSSLRFGALSLAVSTQNYDVIGTDRGGAVQHLSAKNRTAPCVKIFREISIDYLGRVFPCCNIFPATAPSAWVFGRLGGESSGRESCESAESHESCGGGKNGESRGGKSGESRKTGESLVEIFNKKVWAAWRRDLFIEGAKKSPCSTCRDGIFPCDSATHSAILTSTLKEQK